jgi:hypothetical protein
MALIPSVASTPKVSHRGSASSETVDSLGSDGFAGVGTTTIGFDVAGAASVVGVLDGDAIVVATAASPSIGG